MKDSRTDVELRDDFYPAEVVDNQGWKCQRCGETDENERSVVDGLYCSSCARSDAQNTTVARKTNSGWQELAAELGLELYERQPEETDTEWRIWDAYRSAYPLKLPSFTELAKRTGYSVKTVVDAAARWSFKVRLIAWARVTDADIQQKRIESVRAMNVRQLEMSQRLQEKISDAIDFIDPQTLKPNEVANLFKMATELERKVVTFVDEQVSSTVTEAGKKNTELTKPADIAEIVEILTKTGSLKGKVGIEQTTRIIADGVDTNE